MLLGGGRRTTTGDGSGMVATAGAGGPALVYPPICGIRPWLAFSDGGMAALVGRRLPLMKDFNPGGGVEGGVAARMGRTGFTVCGMRACGMPTATRHSGVAPFLPALTGLADHIKDLVLRHANSLA